MIGLELQRASYDCGPTALQGALKFYGRLVSWNRLVRLAGTTPKKGTSAAGLKRALDALGVCYTEYHSRSRQRSWVWARKQTMPSVLSFDEDEHWVLLCVGLGRRGVLVFDPEVGFRIFARKDFLARWVNDGRVYAIQLRRKGC